VDWGFLGAGCWGGCLDLEEDRAWRVLHSDELHGLYSSLNIVWVIKSGRVEWAGHVADVERRKVFTGFCLGGPGRGAAGKTWA